MLQSYKKVLTYAILYVNTYVKVCQYILLIYVNTYFAPRLARIIHHLQLIENYIHQKVKYKLPAAEFAKNIWPILINFYTFAPFSEDRGQRRGAPLERS